MVAINNNIGDKFKIINSNLPSEKTDELFAELFALMNLENLDTIDKNPLKDKKPLKDIVIQQLNTKTKRLIKDGNRITGIEIEVDNKVQIISARRGVIIATGGFEWNKELVRKLLRGGS